MEKVLGLIKNDPWLEPYSGAINGRHEFVLRKESELTGNGKVSLSDFADGYLYFGLHKSGSGWVLREWAPNATKMFLVGTFNDWQEKPAYQFKAKKNGVWELKMKPEAIKHRLDVYEAQTAPLIGYYREKGNLMDVDSSPSPEAIVESIMKAL